MAVEIPVVIDINQAFKDAAAKVGTASKPLVTSIEKLNAKLAVTMEKMNHYQVDSTQWKGAVKEIQRITELLDLASDKVKIYGSNTGSIRQMEAELSRLSRQWEKLGTSQKFTASGELTADAKKLVSDYKAVAAEVQKTGRSLAQIEAEERRILEIAQKKRQTYKDEQRILASTTKTMNILSQQERILSSRLQATPVGSPKYKDLSIRLMEVRKEMALASAQAQRGGAAYRELGASANKATTGITATNTALKAQRGIFATLQNYLSGYVMLFAGLRFVRNIRETTAELELQRVALGSIVQDAEFANDLFRQIKAAALKSPFEIKDLVTYTKQLSAYRIENEKLFSTTMKLADISAGLGVDMGRLILAFGQVRAAAVLRGQELRQFTEAGIPLVDKLAEKFTKLRGEAVSAAEVFDLISKRAVPFKMIEEIFDDMTSAGGTFYKMQEKQSETLKGQWMKLKDAVTIMYDEIGNTPAVHKAMTDLIQGALSLARSWRQIGDTIGSLIAVMVAYKTVAAASALASNSITKAEAARLAITKSQTIAIPKLIAKMMGETAAKKLSASVSKEFAVAQYRAATATSVLEAALWKSYAALIKNPYALAAAAVVALGFALYNLAKHGKAAEVSIDSLEQATAALNTQVSKSNDVFKLISAYEQLSAKTNKTAEEQEKLGKVSRELAKIYPSTVEGIDNETNALQLNIDKVKELTEAEQELAVAHLKSLAREAENQLPMLEKERETLVKKVTQGVATDLWGGREMLSAEGSKKAIERINELTEKILKYEEAIEDVKKLDEAEFIGPLPKKQVDEATASLVPWKKTLTEIHEEKIKAGMAQIFTPDDIEKMGDIHDLWKKTKKGISEAEEALAAYKALSLTLVDADAIKANEASIAQTEKTLEFFNKIKDTFGFVFKKTSGSRDNRLSQLKSDISELTNAYKKFLDLQKYMSKETALKEIDKLFPQLAGWEPTLDNVIKKLQTRLEDVKKQLAKSPKSKTLLDMQRALETEISNLQVDNLKTQLEKKIKQISDEMKRSETARKFWQDILDLTGDQQLATNLSMDVYGTVGDEFKDRIGKELYEALHEFDKLNPGEINPDLLTILDGDLTIFDFKDIKKHLSELPDDVRKVFEEAIAQNEKFNADWYLDFIKTFKKAESYTSRIATLNNQRTQKLLEVRSKGGTKADEKAVNKYFDEKVAGVQLEALKDTHEWTKAFEDLESVSDTTLRNLISLIDEYIKLNRQNLEPQQLKELTRAREQAQAQLLQRHSIEGLTGALKKYEEASDRRNKLEKTGFIFSKRYKEAVDDQKRALKELSDAYAALIEELNTYIASTKELMSTFASDDDASYWSSQLDNLSKSLSGVGKAVIGITQIATGNVTPQAIAQTVSGLSEVVSGIFGGIKAKQIRDANKAIDAQDEKLKALSKSYDRLGEAMASSFGTDYIYNLNQQLDILLAKQKAYEEQAKQEESKGKKADKKKAEEYRQSAEDAASEYETLKTKVAEFFTETDVQSAAKDFANAWIEAYKEFGSTTDAMKEKFQDMIQNMVQQSLAAQIVQRFLQPIFDEINKMSEDGALDATDIATVSKMATNVIPQINDAMTNLMAQLSAAGYNMRQQAGKFTGISRDIASASEESILGLAAGINTQNAYMSMISTDVRQILALMGGGTTQTATPQSTVTTEETGVAEMPSVQKMVYDHLPNIDSNISNILTAIHRVIKTEGSQSYVSVRM